MKFILLSQFIRNEKIEAKPEFLKVALPLCMVETYSMLNIVGRLEHKHRGNDNENAGS